MINCSLCRDGITDSQLVYENKLMYVVYPRKPQVYGHLMIVPKRHTQLYSDMTNKEAISLKETIHYILHKFTLSNQAIGFNILSNNGPEDVGQHVPHVHVHVFIRFQNDINPFKVLSKQLPRKQLTSTEWEEQVNRIKLLLKQEEE